MTQATPPQVIVAGHVCLDMIPAFDKRSDSSSQHFEPGQLVQVGPCLLAGGGVVSNTGLTLHRLGISTRLMGKVGDDDFGRALLSLFRAYDESLTAGMRICKGATTSYTFVLAPPGVDRMFIHCPGANDFYTADDVALDHLAPARLFHFGYPTLMAGILAGDGAELVRLMRGVKGRRLTTSLDMSLPDPNSAAGRANWPLILERALPYTDLFLPSLEELLFMLDRERLERLPREPIKSDELVSLAQTLLDMGVAVAGIKLGHEGLYLRATPDRARLLAGGDALAAAADGWVGREQLRPCFEVQVASTNGAGDATIGGLLAALLKGQPMDAAAATAVAVGGCCVERIDATSGVQSWDATQARISAGWRRRDSTLKLPGQQDQESPQSR